MEERWTCPNDERGAHVVVEEHFMPWRIGQSVLFAKNDTVTMGTTPEKALPLMRFAGCRKGSMKL